MQLFVSRVSKGLLGSFPVKQLLQLASEYTIRSLSVNSATLRQIFARQDAFKQMYKFLLSSRGSVTEANRLQYRNALVLVLADFITGALFGILFTLFAPQIYSFFANFLAYFTNGFFEEYLDWLMGWPAGFKFNANLTRFLGRVFLLLLRTWQSIRNYSLVIYLQFLVIIRFRIPFEVVNTVILLVKYLGFSVIVSIAVDLFSVATLHIRFFHRLIGILYRAYFCALLSLFRLFQGRKWNVLRHRVDSTAYSMDQLLVGMLLFAILWCTFPTICAYYFLFVSAVQAIKLIQCAADSIATLFCVLPLFSLLQRNSAVLSEGIKLQPLKLTTPPAFLLQMEPISMNKLLQNYFTQQKRNWTSKFNKASLEHIITGKVK